MLYVEGKSCVLEAVCSACLEAAAAAAMKQTAIVADRLTTEGEVELDEKTLHQRVQWMEKSRTFQVTYQAKDGKTHRSIKGLSVGNKRGRQLDGSPYRRAFKAVMEQAKEQWDALDDSSAPRFSDESSA